ncbi:MAG: glucose 1-dehydrogenase [Anaerolineae bacterium]|nr:glucose 1-dehydrogenase [Anaerolineae bacterium]
MEPLLTGKVAIVTGGGGALGGGAARGMAREGASIVIADMKGGEETANDICRAGGKAIAVKCDVSHKESVDSMVAEAVKAFGGVDILMNNAAIYPSRPWTEISEEEWDRVFAVNIKGYYLCARAVYPHMQQRCCGKIINISSVTFALGKWDKLLHYVSTKGAVVGFTRALARELGPEGITVNCIAPGAFPTDAEKIHPDPEGYNQFVLENQMIKRRGTPDDIANAVIFLASHMSDFITGQMIVVDGGWVTH